MSFKLSPPEVSAWATLIGVFSAACGWVASVFKTRRDHRIEESKISVAHEDVIQKRVTTLFERYDVRITDQDSIIEALRRELGELRATVNANTEARQLAEINAATARQQADDLLIQIHSVLFELENTKKELEQARGENAVLLARIAELEAQATAMTAELEALRDFVDNAA